MALITSYSELNKTGNDIVYNVYEDAQTFLCPADYLLTSVKFYVKKQGSPTGNVNVKLYATSAGIPIGDPLAISDAMDVSTISGAAYNLVEWTFTDSGTTQYQLLSGTTYAVSLDYRGGNGANNVNIAHHSAGTYANGNWYNYNG